MYPERFLGDTGPVPQLIPHQLRHRVLCCGRVCPVCPCSYSRLDNRLGCFTGCLVAHSIDSTPTRNDLSMRQYRFFQWQCAHAANPNRNRGMIHWDRLDNRVIIKRTAVHGSLSAPQTQMYSPTETPHAHSPQSNLTVQVTPSSWSILPQISLRAGACVIARAYGYTPRTSKHPPIPCPNFSQVQNSRLCLVLESKRVSGYTAREYKHPP